MPEPRRRPFLLGVLVVPLALSPFVLGALLTNDARFFVLAAVISFAAPAGGFWLGEVFGATGPSRAGIGCVATLGLFILDCVWAFGLAPRIFGP